MKIATYRKRGIVKIGHVWFSTELVIPKADILMIHGMESDQYDVPENYRVNSQATLLTNLSLNKDELWKKIRKNTRYEIRRAEKEGVTTQCFRSKDIPEKLLLLFKTIYEEMYASKGMNSTFNMDLVKVYIKNDMISFSVAFFKDEPLVFHSYIIDDEHARFFYSCSPFRIESEMANLIGRMNRLLHWKDFLYFKENGIIEYDWGGINSIAEPDSIAQFKYAFGGDPVVKYNYVVAESIIGKILLRYKYK